MKRADINIFLAIIATFALALVLNDPNRSATTNPVWEPVTLRNPSASATQLPTSPLTSASPLTSVRPLTSISSVQPQSQPTMAPPFSAASQNPTSMGVRPAEYTARRLPMTSQPPYLPPSVIRNRRPQVPVQPSVQTTSQSSRVMPLPPADVDDEQAVKAAVYRMGPDAPNAIRFANGWKEL
ncbi:MAG: hypothetical protein AAF497_22540 [Planctomycetota bacterium]